MRPLLGGGPGNAGDVPDVWPAHRQECHSSPAWSVELPVTGDPARAVIEDSRLIGLQAELDSSAIALIRTEPSTVAGAAAPIQYVTALASRVISRLTAWCHFIIRKLPIQ